jgi:hypothetical protein
VISTLLLEQALVSHAIAELLAQLPGDCRQLLLIADDNLPDGGADQLLEQLRCQPGIERVRGLVYLPRAVATTRLQQLWMRGPTRCSAWRAAAAAWGCRRCWI